MRSHFVSIASKDRSNMKYHEVMDRNCLVSAAVWYSALRHVAGLTDGIQTH